MKLARLFRANTAGFVFAALSMAATAGCGGGIKTAPVDSPLPARDFSASTQGLLTTVGLGELARQDPRKAIEALEKSAKGESPDPDMDVAIAEVALRGAMLAEREGEDPLGFYLCAAFRSFQALRAQPNPGQSTAVGIYNTSISQLVVRLEANGWPRMPVEVNGPARRYTLEFGGPEAREWSPDLFTWTPADRLELKGLAKHVREDGVGTPIVVARRELNQRPTIEHGYNPAYERFYALSALLQFDGDTDGDRTARLTLVDPLEREIVEVDGVDLPLAIDLSAVMATLIQEVDPESLGGGGMFHAGKHLDYDGLNLLEPYRSDKLPVIFVHGLAATAGTWVQMLNELRGDPGIRSRFQFWVYQYPSGLPILYAERLLRESIEETVADLDPQAANPDLDRIVVVGHSMGGLLARMLVSDSGSTLWDAVFTRPIDDLDLDSAEIEYLRRLLFLERDPDIGRVVFLATPHRGAPMASGMIGKMGAALVKLPPDVAEMSRSILAKNRDALTPEAAGLEAAQDAIQGLERGGLLAEALSQLEFNGVVPYHSVMGDRGKKKSREDSSDGVVPYWSSQLDGAESELVVPKNHIVQDDPLCIAEVRRILLEHDADF